MENKVNQIEEMIKKNDLKGKFHSNGQDMSFISPIDDGKKIFIVFSFFKGSYSAYYQDPISQISIRLRKESLQKAVELLIKNLKVFIDVCDREISLGEECPSYYREDRQCFNQALSFVESLKF